MRVKRVRSGPRVAVTSVGLLALAAATAGLAGSTTHAVSAPSHEAGAPTCKFERDGVYGIELAIQVDPACEDMILRIHCKDAQVVVYIEAPVDSGNEDYDYANGPVTCDAIRSVTVIGTDGEDTLNLRELKKSKGFDLDSGFISGLKGSDEIWGTGFDDEILAGAGREKALPATTYSATTGKTPSPADLVQMGSAVGSTMTISAEETNGTSWRAVRATTS